MQQSTCQVVCILRNDACFAALGSQSDADGVMRCVRQTVGDRFVITLQSEQLNQPVLSEPGQMQLSLPSRRALV